VPFAAHQDVRGLEVPVNEAALMRGGERVGQRSRHGDEAFDRQTVGRNSLCQGKPLDQLHGKEVNALGFLHRVDGDDVGMVDGGESPGLSSETGQPVRIGRKRLGQDLDGDLAVEAGVEGSPDLTHAPLADLLDEAIVGEHLAGLESHRLRPLVTSLTDDPAAPESTMDGRELRFFAPWT
jgi:hypothetical protein